MCAAFAHICVCNNSSQNNKPFWRLLSSTVSHWQSQLLAIASLLKDSPSVSCIWLVLEPKENYTLGIQQYHGIAIITAAIQYNMTDHKYIA